MLVWRRAASRCHSMALSGCSQVGCTGCGRCNPHCPQSIDIPKEIAMIDKWIDTLKNEEAGR